MGLIKDLFYRGDYGLVLQKTYEQSQKLAPDDFAYVIGSLSFLGRIQEAEGLAKSSWNDLTDVQKSYAYFFLALARTRRSQYAPGQKVPATQP